MLNARSKANLNLCLCDPVGEVGGELLVQAIPVHKVTGAKLAPWLCEEGLHKILTVIESLEQVLTSRKRISG